MVTKGEILTIDYLSNTCTIRMPLFETIASNPITTTAIFAIPPGMFNGYQVGDVVEVGFENNMINKPVVLGKLYLGVKTENNNYRGSIQCDSLEVKNKVILPSDTQISYGKGQNSLSIDSDATNYTSIKDIINSIQKLENNSNSVYFDDGENQSTTKTKLAEYIVIDGVRKKLGTSLSDLKDYSDFSDQIQTSFKKVDDKLDWEIEKVDYQINALDEEQKTITTKIASVETATDEKLGKLKKETDTSLQIAVGEIHSWVDEQIKDENNETIKRLRTDIDQTAAAIDLVAQKQEGNTYNISQLELTADNISAEVKEKVNSVDSDSENTFGWIMNTDGVNFYDENKNVLEINSAGLKVAGEVQAESGHIGCVSNVIPDVNSISLKPYFELHDYFSLPNLALTDQSTVSTDNLNLYANFKDNTVYPDYSVKLTLKALPENSAEILATFTDKRSTVVPAETTELNLNTSEVFSEIYTTSVDTKHIDASKLKDTIYIELKETETGTGLIAEFSLDHYDETNYLWAIYTSTTTTTEYNLEVYFDVNESADTKLKYDWLYDVPFEYYMNWCYYDGTDYSIFSDNDYIINDTQNVFTADCVLNKYITLYNPFSYAVHYWSSDEFFEIELDPNSNKKSDTDEILGSTSVIAYYTNDEDTENWYELKLTANTDYVTSDYFKGLKTKKEDPACYWKYEWFAIPVNSFEDVLDEEGNFLYRKKIINPLDATKIYSGYVLYDEILENANLITNDDGFKITTNNIHNTKKTFKDYLSNGIYLGTDGIALGAGGESNQQIELFKDENYNGIHKFSVSKNGNVIATEGIFGLPQKLTGVNKVSTWKVSKNGENYTETEDTEYQFTFQLLKTTGNWYFISSPNINSTIPLIFTEAGAITARGSYKFDKFYYETNGATESYLYKNNNLHLVYKSIIKPYTEITADIDISKYTTEADIKNLTIQFSCDYGKSDAISLDTLFDISTRGFKNIFTNKTIFNYNVSLLDQPVDQDKSIGTYYNNGNFNLGFENKDAADEIQYFQFNSIKESTSYLSYTDLKLYNKDKVNITSSYGKNTFNNLYLKNANNVSILNFYNGHFLKIDWKYETDFSEESLEKRTLYLSRDGYHTKNKNSVTSNEDGCIYSWNGMAFRSGTKNTIINSLGLTTNSINIGGDWLGQIEQVDSGKNSTSLLFEPNISNYSIKIGAKTLKSEAGGAGEPEPYIGIHYVGSGDDSITDYTGNNGIPIRNLIYCGYKWPEIDSIINVLNVKTFLAAEMTSGSSTSGGSTLSITIANSEENVVTLLSYRANGEMKTELTSISTVAKEGSIQLVIEYSTLTAPKSGSITIAYLCL